MCHVQMSGKSEYLTNIECFPEILTVNRSYLNQWMATSWTRTLTFKLLHCHVDSSVLQVGAVSVPGCPWLSLCLSGGSEFERSHKDRSSNSELGGFCLHIFFPCISNRNVLMVIHKKKKLFFFYEAKKGRRWRWFITTFSGTITWDVAFLPKKCQISAFHSELWVHKYLPAATFLPGCDLDSFLVRQMALSTKVLGWNKVSNSSTWVLCQTRRCASWSNVSILIFFDSILGADCSAESLQTSGRPADPF